MSKGFKDFLNEGTDVLNENAAAKDLIQTFNAKWPGARGKFIAAAKKAGMKGTTAGAYWQRNKSKANATDQSKAGQIGDLATDNDSGLVDQGAGSTKKNAASGGSQKPKAKPKAKPKNTTMAIGKMLTDDGWTLTNSSSISDFWIKSGRTIASRKSGRGTVVMLGNSSDDSPLGSEFVKSNIAQLLPYANMEINKHGGFVPVVDAAGVPISGAKKPITSEGDTGGDSQEPNTKPKAYWDIKFVIDKINADPELGSAKLLSQGRILVTRYDNRKDYIMPDVDGPNVTVDIYIDGGKRITDAAAGSATGIVEMYKREMTLNKSLVKPTVDNTPDVVSAITNDEVDHDEVRTAYYQAADGVQSLDRIVAGLNKAGLGKEAQAIRDLQAMFNNNTTLKALGEKL